MKSRREEKIWIIGYIRTGGGDPCVSEDRYSKIKKV
jgi:hypothetical protein